MIQQKNSHCNDIGRGIIEKVSQVKHNHYSSWIMDYIYAEQFQLLHAAYCSYVTVTPTYLPYGNTYLLCRFCTFYMVAKSLYIWCNITPPQLSLHHLHNNFTLLMSLYPQCYEYATSVPWCQKYHHDSITESSHLQYVGFTYGTTHDVRYNLHFTEHIDPNFC